MKDHVADLETAKKLKDYLPEGFESYFVWARYKNKNDIRRLPKDKGWSDWSIHPTKIGMNVATPQRVREAYPALILNEMLELLPKRSDGNILNVPVDGEILNLALFYYTNPNTNPATAVCQLYMWLVDKGYVGMKNSSIFYCNYKKGDCIGDSCDAYNDPLRCKQ
jgi:hypothetical protein